MSDDARQEKIDELQSLVDAHTKTRNDLRVERQELDDKIEELTKQRDAFTATMDWLSQQIAINNKTIRDLKDGRT